MALDLYAHAVMGCRKIARVLKIIQSFFKIRVPHHTTVRQWVLRNGCYLLEKDVEKANDWVVIADLTVDVGAMKCLVILGVRMKTLKNRANLTLSHDDVEVLALSPTTNSNGEHCEKALREVGERIGNIQAIVADL